MREYDEEVVDGGHVWAPYRIRFGPRAGQWARRHRCERCHVFERGMRCAFPPTLTLCLGEPISVNAAPEHGIVLGGGEPYRPESSCCARPDRP